MVDNTEEFYKIIGRTIATAGAIEGKIDCIIADEYFGRANSEERKLFTDEVLSAGVISLGKKVDILFTIMTRRKLEFTVIKRSNLKVDFLKLRNELAHSQIEYDFDTVKPETTPVLKFKIRNSHKTLQEKEAEFETLGVQISMELERLFFDALWGN
jgi:hypothetical protein